MNRDGWYYLHTNGSLIYKPDHDGVVADIRDSDFAVAFWPIDVNNRLSAWTVLVEGLAAGADPVRIKELANKWECDNRDAEVYADVIGAGVFKDGNNWCAVPENFVFSYVEEPAGFGATALEALAALAKKLGYHPQKTWGNSFAGLLKKQTRKNNEQK